MAKATRMLLSFFMGTSFCCLFLILLLYMAGSIPSWVEKGVQLLHEETGIAIELSGFSGNLWRDFSFKHLTLKLEGFNLNAENGHIRWQPKRLWRKTIVVESLKAEKLKLTFGGGDEEDSGPPNNIGLPFLCKRTPMFKNSLSPVAQSHCILPRSKWTMPIRTKHITLIF